MIRVALAQMTSTSDCDQNLATMRSLLEKAVASGARLVVFPEMAYGLAPASSWTKWLPRFDELRSTFSSWAKELGVYLVPGSVREPAPPPDSATRFFNTLLYYGPDGGELGRYQKIHLFQANLPDRKYLESQWCEKGMRVVVAPGPDGLKIGMSVCFDLRFPELFRAQRAKGARLILVPAAFTVPTGRAHWHTLLRARAIENQAFVLAPGQTGRTGEGADTFGHSLVVNPWGDVLVDAEEGVGVHFADLDPAAFEEASRKVDAWGCQRADLFPL